MTSGHVGIKRQRSAAGSQEEGARGSRNSVQRPCGDGARGKEGSGNHRPKWLEAEEETRPGHGQGQALKEHGEGPKGIRYL